MARINMVSAKFSSLCILSLSRVCSDQYDDKEAMRKNTVSMATRSSARFSRVCKVITTRSKPITVRHTPMIAEDTVKIWIQVFSSSRLSKFGFNMSGNGSCYSYLKVEFGENWCPNISIFFVKQKMMTGWKDIPLQKRYILRPGHRTRLYVSLQASINSDAGHSHRSNAHVNNVAGSNSHGARSNDHHTRTIHHPPKYIPDRELR